jgi:hypothetical protein
MGERTTKYTKRPVHVFLVRGSDAPARNPLKTLTRVITRQDAII